MLRLLFFISISIFLSSNLYSQGDFCIESDPFCTSNLYSFPAGVNSGTAESGHAYGCLGTQPNPAWYHMKIAVSGNINIYMFSTPLEDIDFICWGPFTDPTLPCQGGLPASKIVSCSYSGDPTENCYIPNGVEGEYYLLLITNFSNDPCDITFEKTSGSGETDCTIVPPPIGSNSPLCYGDELQLWADDFTNATYHWTGPNSFDSNLQNPVLNNVTLEDAGDYSLVITVNGSASDAVTTNVEVSPKPTPEFNFNDACFGDTTFFTDMSTVDPPDQNITSWQWDFDDGQVGTGENVWHLYTTDGEYEVKLTTSTALMGCPQTITKTVNVYNAAGVEAGEDQTLPNGWSAELQSTINGGSGSYDILWTPEDLISDPTVEDPVTNPLGATQVFKITVTDSETQCTNSDSTTVIVTGGALSLAVSANPMVFCQDGDEIIHLSASPSGGSGNNTYSWTSNPAGFTSDIKEPSDFPDVTTTYTCSVFDGQTYATNEITITAKPTPVGEAGEDKSITVGTSTFMDGANVNGGSGNYNVLWTPTDQVVDNTVLQAQTKLLNENTELSLQINDNNGCSSVIDKVWIFVGGDGLNVNPTANPDVICLNEVTTLKANAFGGGENHTYYWYNDNGWESTEENPEVSPSTTTDYTVDVNDGFKTVSSTTTVLVNPLPIVELLPEGYEYFSIDTIKACVKDSVLLDAGNEGNPANMNYLWSNTATTRKLKVTTAGSWIDFQTYSVEVQNPVTLCSQNAILTTFFDFNECEIGVNEISSLNDNISISPNPSEGIFKVEISGLEKTIDISIKSINGQTIYSESDIDIKNNKFIKSVDLSDIPNGIYLINITHETGIYNSRIIKQ